MPGRKDNSLRTHHLLIARAAAGFTWQIRYGRHAGVVEQSSKAHATVAEAEAAGTEALLRHRSASDRLTDGDVTK